MDVQVNKNQLDRVTIKWLNKHFGNLTPKRHKDHPYSVFYVNSEDDVLMEYDQGDWHFYIHDDNIWSKIELLFHLNHDEIQSIMKHWLKETYKLEGVKPVRYYTDSFLSWLELTNWND